ncbi:MAG TPA: hypothetical protein VGM90_25415 [Kofleriaceae bacterium]
MTDLPCVVIAIAENFAYIDLGEEALGGHYKEGCARVVARVALTFPDADPYGLVVMPVLHRSDDKPVDRQHPGHPHATPAATALGVTDFAFWSWNWERMPRSKPEDMASVAEWARKRFRQVES